MLTVRLGETEFTFDEISALESLTGTESAAVEDYLGGWHRFRADDNRTRTVVVIVWLARRSAGEQVTLDDVAATPGLIFGANAPEIVESDDDPAKDPGRPLVETSDERGTNGGGDGSDSGSTPAISAATGPRLSDVSTA